MTDKNQLWMCNTCTVTHMLEKVAFDHAYRKQHRIIFQTPEALMERTATQYAPYSTIEKERITLTGEARLGSHFFIGERNASRSLPPPVVHPHSDRCLACRDTDFPCYSCQENFIRINRIGE